MKINMKRWMSLLAMSFVLLLSVSMVQAGNISSLTAKAESGSVKIEGTADVGVLAVAIMIYDTTGTDLVKMETVSVGDDQKYSDTFKLSNGSYMIKVADYEGGDFQSTTVTVGASEKDKSPKTGEYRVYLTAIAIIGVLMLAGVAYKKRA